MKSSILKTKVKDIIKNLPYIDFRNITYSEYAQDAINFEKFVYGDSWKTFSDGDNSTTLIDIRYLYRESHRYYHSEYHLKEILLLIDYISEQIGDKDLIQDLKITAYFHDAVYNPNLINNESKSMELFEKVLLKKTGQPYLTALINKDRVAAISGAIYDTISHNSRSELSEVFCALDMYVISHYPFDRLLEYEHQIFKEYQFVDYVTYKDVRCSILEGMNQIYNRPELKQLIDYVKFRKPTVGIYAGSFKPLHIGHMSIIREAEKMFDKIIVARGVNPEKSTNIEFETNLQEVFPFHQTEQFTGYLLDFVLSFEDKGVKPFLLKGLRDEKDFQYELKQQRYTNYLCMNRFENDVTHRYRPIQTVYIFADPLHNHISSSDIRLMEKIEPGSAKDLIYPLPYEIKNILSI